MSAVSAFLVVLATILAFLAVPFVSNATAGLAILVFACFLGILARIAQAAAHHRTTRVTGSSGAAWPSHDDFLSEHRQTASR